MNNIEKIKNKLKMRKAVGIILMRDDGLVWTGKRKDGPGIRSGEKKLWQMKEFFKSDYIASKDVNAWLGLAQVIK